MMMMMMKGWRKFKKNVEWREVLHIKYIMLQTIESICSTRVSVIFLQVYMKHFNSMCFIIVIIYT